MSQPLREPMRELRAAEADRRHTIAELQRHYVDGRLGEDELGDRISRALAARTFGDLQALLRDLPASSPFPEPAPPSPATPRARRSALTPEHGFRAHLVSYLAVMALLLAVWLLTTPGGYFWPMWPMLGWGIGLVKHARAHTGRCGQLDVHHDTHRAHRVEPILL